MMKTTDDKRQDRRQALTVILTAYGTAQLVLLVLKLTETVRLSWIATLLPSIIVSSLFLAVIIAGAVLGVRDYKREKALEQKRNEAIKKSLDDFIRSLEEGDDDE